jgi:hypothetical protein
LASQVKSEEFLEFGSILEAVAFAFVRTNSLNTISKFYRKNTHYFPGIVVRFAKALVVCIYPKLDENVEGSQRLLRALSGSRSTVVA